MNNAFSHSIEPLLQAGSGENSESVACSLPIYGQSFVSSYVTNGSAHWYYKQLVTPFCSGTRAIYAWYKQEKQKRGLNVTNFLYKLS